ncbi:Mak10-domain-containing protein [Neoconidiobolus thromboides FSU 785]|nr:Mak10-domain-containing protein [Neoconidiobolus thromboides FSU 785]
MSYNNLNHFHQTKFEDCTQLLFDACDDLQVGELIHGDNFSLIEAMSVIEIMDPKMDSGLNLTVESENQETKLNPIQSYDVHQVITLNQLLYLMDDLFCYELTWFSGYSLGQTIYTCHYVRKVNQLPILTSKMYDLNFKNDIELSEFYLMVLKVYIMGCIKSCQLIWSEFIKGYGYEEEDFSTNKTGLSFYPEITIQQSIKWLDEVEYLISEYSKIKDRKSNIEEKEILKQCKLRIQKRKYFLKSINCLSLLYCEGYPDSNKNLIKLKYLMENEFKIEFSMNNTQSKLTKAFDPNLICLLNINCPPRKIQQMNLKDSYDQFIELIKELIFTTEIIHYKSSLHLNNLIRQFSEKHPKTSAISRSFLSTAIYYDRHFLGKLGLINISREVLRYYYPNLYVIIEYFNKYKNEQVMQKMHEIFMEFNFKLSQFILHQYQLLIKNRSRQYRLLKKYLRLFNQLKYDQTEFTNQMHDLCLKMDFTEDNKELLHFKNEFNLGINDLNVYLYLHQYDSMINYLKIGFDLQLYSHYEYIFIYFQMECLLKQQINFYYKLLKINTWNQSMQYLISLIKQNSNYKHSGHNDNRVHDDESMGRANHHLLHLIYAQLQLKLCEIINIILSLLIHYQVVEGPFRENKINLNEKDELKYQLRFQAFLNVKYNLDYLMFDDLKGKLEVYQDLVSNDRNKSSGNNNRNGSDSMNGYNDNSINGDNSKPHDGIDNILINEMVQYKLNRLFKQLYQTVDYMKKLMVCNEEHFNRLLTINLTMKDLDLIQEKINNYKSFLINFKTSSKVSLKPHITSPKSAWLLSFV